MEYGLLYTNKKTGPENNPVLFTNTYFSKLKFNN